MKSEFFDSGLQKMPNSAAEKRTHETYGEQDADLHEKPHEIFPDQNIVQYPLLDHCQILKPVSRTYKCPEIDIRIHTSSMQCGLSRYEYLINIEINIPR